MADPSKIFEDFLEVATRESLENPALFSHSVVIEVMNHPHLGIFAIEDIVLHPEVNDGVAAGLCYFVGERLEGSEYYPTASPTFKMFEKCEEILLQSDDVVAKYHAAKAFQTNPAEEHVDTLKRALSDGSIFASMAHIFRVMNEAAVALQRLGTPKAIAILAPWIEERKRELKEAEYPEQGLAMQALARLRVKEGLDAIIALIHRYGKDDITCEQAMDILNELGIELKDFTPSEPYILIEP